MFLASLIVYLDDHAGALTALLTLALIIVNAAYVLLNWRTVREAARAREQVLLPKLAVDLHGLDPTILLPAIRNVGPGAALNVDLDLIIEFQGDAPAVARSWRANVIAPGEVHQFVSELSAGHRTPESFRAIHLKGTMKDALGLRHEIDETFDEIAAWWALKASERFVSPPERRLADALETAVAKPIATAIKQASCD